jgi:hypothetical protein
MRNPVLMPGTSVSCCFSVISCILKSCHLCVFDELLDWLSFLEDVVIWTGSIYLDDLVEKIILADSAG